MGDVSESASQRRRSNPVNAHIRLRSEGFTRRQKEVFLEEARFSSVPTARTVIRFRDRGGHATSRFLSDRAGFSCATDGPATYVNANERGDAFFDELRSAAAAEPRPPAAKSSARRVAETVGVGIGAGVVGGIAWGGVGAGLAGLSARLAGDAVGAAVWRGAVPGALIGAVNHGVLPLTESFGAGGRLALAKREARETEAALRRDCGAAYERLCAHEREDRRPKVADLLRLGKLDETHPFRERLDGRATILLDDLLSIPEPYRADAVALAAQYRRLRPTSARKAFDAAVDQWTALGAAALDHVETSSTLGRLFLATGQTGVLTAERTAIQTAAKLKTD